MAQMVSLSPDPTQLRNVLPSFAKTSHIFLPVNDNKDPDLPEGGSHWSLLVVSINDQVSFHYDSLNSANAREGKRISERFGRLLGIELAFKDIEDSPQQANCSDCGVFTCLTMRHLLRRLLKKKRGEKVTMSMANRELDAALGRKELSKTIESLRKEAERRRSS